MRVAMTLEQCWHRVPGGTAVAALELARALASSPGAPELIGVASWHRRPPDPPWTPPIPMRAVPLPRTVLYESWLRWRWPAIDRGVDVVHATTLIVPPRRRTPLVVTVHDLAFLHEPEHFTARGVRLFRRGWQLVRDEADLVLCSSQATYDDCRAHGLDEARLRLVPLGVHVVDVADADVTATLAELGLRNPYVLFVGTLEPRKNLRGLAEAFEHVRAAHPELELVVVGPPGWGDLQAVGRMLGFVSPLQLRCLYRGAAVFCYPSLREGFGLPVLEAMAQGTPVVSSKGTSTEELVAGVGVLVDPHSPIAIAEGILEALGRDGTPGRERALAYGWERTAQRTLDTYRQVSA